MGPLRWGMGGHLPAPNFLPLGQTVSCPPIFLTNVNIFLIDPYLEKMSRYTNLGIAALNLRIVPHFP